MSVRRYENDLVYIDHTIGQNHFGVIDPEPHWAKEENVKQMVLPICCVLDCGDPKRQEWLWVTMVKGNNRTQAMRNLVSGNYRETLDHISECRMDDGAYPF